MQRNGNRVTALLAVFVIVSTLQPVGASSNRSLWVWDHPNDAVIELAVGQGISDIYLHVPARFSRDQRYRAFLESAHEAGLSVFATGGNPSWATDSSSWNAWIDEVVEFDGFDGVVFDVEPHLHPDWDSMRQHRLLRTFVNGLQRASLRAGSLPVLTTVPFWWDLPDYRIRKRLLIEHVLEHSEGIIVMAYRDTAEGQDGIIQLSRNEANLAALDEKQFVIGVEARRADQDKVSFAEEGRARMESELAAVATWYRTNASFGGIAIHDFDSYSSMNP